MCKSNLIALFLCVLVANSHSSHTDCGSTIGTVESLTISKCNDADQKCILHRNTNATVAITFTLKKDVESLKAVVHGIIMDMPVPFQLPNDNGCVDSNLSCPLKSGETYTYTTSLPILKSYPRLSVDVKWELQSPEKEDAVCLLIPAKIQ